jgi:anti-anti-sigma factor
MTDESSYRLTIDETDAAVVGHVSGEIDHGNAGELQAAILGKLTTGPLILDLSRLEFIDSAGLAVLETVRRATPVWVVIPPESIINRVFEIVGLENIIPTYTSLDDALVHVREADSKPDEGRS